MIIELKKPHMLYRSLTVACCLLMAGCAGPGGFTTSSIPGRTEAAAAQLAPGMTREQVIKLLGPPQGFLQERNSVECLVYTDRETQTAPTAMTGHAMTMARDRIVVMRHGLLLEHHLIETGMPPKAAASTPVAVTTACTTTAAKFDRSGVVASKK